MVMMTTCEPSEDSVAMSDYVHVVWRRRGTVTVVALIVTLLGIVLTGLSPELFESEAVIYLSADSDRIYAEAPSAVAAIMAPSFLERVAGEVGIAERGRVLRRMVRAVPMGDGKLLRLRTRHRDPERSQELNLAVTRAFLSRASGGVRRKRELAEAQLRHLNRQLAEIERLFRLTEEFLTGLQAGRSRGVEGGFSRSFALNAMGIIAGQMGDLNATRRRLEQELLTLELPTVIEAAAMPAEPVGPHRLRNIVFSLLLGTVAGVAAAFIVEYVKSSAPLPEAPGAARSRSI